MTYARGTAVALAALNLGLFALLHLLRTDGEGSALMLVATIAAGLAAIALASLVRPLVSGRFGPLGVGLLVFFGVARVLQVFFPVGTGTTVTTGEQIYDTLDAFAFFVLPIAALCVAFALRSRWSIGLAVALAAALVPALAGSGLAQRFVLGLGAGWLLVTALTAKSSHPVDA